MSKYQELQQFLLQNQYTWLVTGVAGFIGSNLLEKLLVLNQNVIGIDNFETGYQKNIDDAINEASKINGSKVHRNFEFIHGDIRNLKVCEKACHGIDFVLHHAALGSVPRSIEDPINTNKTNIDGFLNMLVASRDANVKRFVYAASSSTYGDHPDLPKEEDKVGCPLSPYAVSKAVNELYASVFAKTYGFKTIGLRYFNIFGKRQDPNGAYAAVIPTWVADFIKDKDIFINGDGKTSRDFCYIDNTVQINILAALTSDEDALDQVYNVALNNNTNLNELYQMIKKRLIVCVPNIENKSPIYRDFRKGDVLHSQASIEKAQKLLEYEPTHTISEGLDEAIDWYLNNLYK